MTQPKINLTELRERPPRGFPPKGWFILVRRDDLDSLLDTAEAALALLHDADTNRQFGNTPYVFVNRLRATLDRYTFDRLREWTDR